jgi:hypothetical protein
MQPNGVASVCPKITTMNSGYGFVTKKVAKNWVSWMGASGLKLNAISQSGELEEWIRELKKSGGGHPIYERLATTFGCPVLSVRAVFALKIRI